MRMWSKERHAGFLLLEVLVALAIFVIMVGCVSFFVRVWLDADHDMRARHDALEQVCGALEGMVFGCLPNSQTSSFKMQGKTAQISQTTPDTFWVVTPAWVAQLGQSDLPVHYCARAQACAGASKYITVKVRG